MSWIIRPALSNDISALNALTFSSKASNGYDADFMEQCREELTLSEERMSGWVTKLIEDDQSTIIGYYSLSFDASVAQIEMFFILPEMKRQGLGKALWQALEVDAKANGISVIRIDSDPISAPFYKAMGAHQIGSVPSGSIPGRYLPLLQVDLAGTSQLND